MSATDGTAGSGSVQPPDEAGVMQLFESWRKSWLTLDVDRMLSVFDDDVVYLAEENEHVLEGIEALRLYWHHTRDRVLARVDRWEPVAPPVLQFLLPDSACLYAELDTRLVPRRARFALEGMLRATLVLRRRGSGDAWRAIHYHESRHLFLRPKERSDLIFAPDMRATALEETSQES